MNQRLLSLDVMRGMIMILLASEAAGLYEHINETSFPKIIINQFFHHEWHGLRFWDLIQPSFMTMAGTALYLSYIKQESKGIGWKENLPKVAWRCVKLLACGVGLHCVYSGKMVWELWNVSVSYTHLVFFIITAADTGHTLLNSEEDFISNGTFSLSTFTYPFFSK